MGLQEILKDTEVDAAIAQPSASLIYRN